jgi:hypothetical protein
MSKKDISNLVSDIRLWTNIFLALIEEVRKRGGTGYDIQRLNEPEGRAIITRLADLIINPSEATYVIEVPTSTIANLIQSGDYGWYNDNINDQNFTSDEPHQVEIILRHFNESMSTEAVLKTLEEENLRPATLSELLAFGIRYHQPQLEFRIAALGSVSHNSGNRVFVAYLDRHGLDGRGLLVEYFNIHWPHNYRFAVVRKPTKIFPIKVEAKTISDLVKAGNYPQANVDISDANFSADKPHEAGVILKHFGQQMSSDDILKELDREGLRPVTMSELLALGAQHPQLQLKFDIIGLGSVWQEAPTESRLCGAIFRHYLTNQRVLDLHVVDYEQLGGFRFAAVPK